MRGRWVPHVSFVRVLTFSSLCGLAGGSAALCLCAAPGEAERPFLCLLPFSRGASSGPVPEGPGLWVCMLLVGGGHRQRQASRC